MIVDHANEPGSDLIARTFEDLPSVDLSPSANRYLRESIKPNTQRSYRSQLRLWSAWCAEQRLVPFPAEPAAVANWLAARADGGKGIATLKTGVAAIKFGHDLLGLPFDSQAPAITKVLRGIRNDPDKLHVPRQAEPLRASDVLRLIDVPRTASLIELRDAALVSIGYLFALRRSELVGLDFATVRKGGGGLGFLKLAPTNIELTLYRSKTNTGEAESVTIPRDGNEVAIEVLERWVRRGGITAGDPLFPRLFRGGRIGKRMSGQSVALIIKKMIGPHATEFSGHSLRVGFAVTAAEAGADLRSIASVTRHRSIEMPRRYAQRADQIRTSPYLISGVGLTRKTTRGRGWRR